MVQVKPGVKYEDVTRSLFSVIWAMREKPILESEVDKARNQIMTEYVNEFKTVNSRASSLASSEIIYGDYRRSFTELEKYSAVTAQSIQEMVKTFMQPTQRSMIRLKPKGGE